MDCGVPLVATTDETVALTFVTLNVPLSVPVFAVTTYGPPAVAFAVHVILAWPDELVVALFADRVHVAPPTAVTV